MMTNLCSNYFLRLHFFGFLCKPKPFSGNKQRLASGGCQHSTSFLSALPATPHHTPCWHRFLRVVLYWFSHCYSCAADDDGADLLLVRLMFRLLKVVPWWLLRVGGWWAGCHRGPRRSTSWSSHLPGQLSRGNQTSPNAATFWLNNTNREHFLILLQLFLKWVPVQNAALLGLMALLRSWLCGWEKDWPQLLVKRMQRSAENQLRKFSLLRRIGPGSITARIEPGLSHSPWKLVQICRLHNCCNPRWGRVTSRVGQLTHRWTISNPQTLSWASSKLKSSTKRFHTVVCVGCLHWEFSFCPCLHACWGTSSLFV